MRLGGWRIGVWEVYEAGPSDREVAAYHPRSTRYIAFVRLSRLRRLALCLAVGVLTALLVGTAIALLAPPARSCAPAPFPGVTYTGNDHGHARPL